MKIFAICGSYNKKGTISSLMDEAIDGIKSADPNVEVDKIHLIDKKNRVL